MQKYKFGDYQVELDMDATMNWYVQFDGWGCACGHCRNFLQLARKKAIPEYMIEILDALGIPPEKATYVGELFTDETGVHYQFSYRLAGVIIDSPNATADAAQNDIRCCHEPYPYGAPDFPEPHFDLEFYATLPWVLEES